MKFNLSIKIFLAFLFISLAGIGAMVGAIRYFSLRSFEEYIVQRDRETLNGLVQSLADFHADRGGWDDLKTDRRLFRRVVDPLGAESGLGPSEGPRGPRQGQGRRPDQPPQPTPRPGQAGPRSLFQRLGLFDHQRQLIVGAPDVDPQTLTPILIGGETAGWIGLQRGPGPRRFHPREQEFLDQQNFILYATGAVILVLSALMAFVLARHLLSPIRKLTAAFTQVAGRRFDARVSVRSNDELGQLARDFNAMAQDLGAYEDRQRQWLADISHEMRTPLSVLIGEIEALQDQVRQPTPQSLDSLHQEAERLSKIIADLHTLSLSDAGALPLHKTPAHPLQVLRQTIGRFQTRLNQNQINVTADLGDSPGPNVMGDPDRLGQLFSNLIENVLKYVDQPGDLNIGHEVKDGQLLISFDDSGPGVPPEALPKLFDRLYRVDQSRSRSTGGAGLGLSICQAIARAHGGQISAISGQDGGLRIQIQLPLPQSG
jgi:two-component system sensor histidine kinase BaeS